MVSYCMPLAVLDVFKAIVSVIPDGVPSRWEKVATCLGAYLSQTPDITLSPKAVVGNTGHTVNLDVGNRRMLKDLHNFLLESNDRLWLQTAALPINEFYSMSGIYPLVLIPAITECKCGERLTTDSRHSVVTLYSTTGAKKASSFHKKCPSKSCGLKYYYSYTLSMDGVKAYFADDYDYFLLTSQTAFEKLYLRATTDLIEVAALPFTVVCECFETTHAFPMERQRLEEAYFISSLLKKSPQLLTSQRGPSCWIDLETLCQDYVDSTPHVATAIREHQCQTPGCAEGFLMADGIEKIHRRTCAAPKSEIRLAACVPRIIGACPETPLLANNSAYCQSHQHLNEEQPPAKSPRLVMTIDVRHMRVSQAVLSASTDLPANDDPAVHVGCKQAKKVVRFTNRSAGIMAFVRLCGMIVDYAEMLTCESPSQLFVQLLRFKCDSGASVRYVGYDRGCEFHPFLKNLAKAGNPGADILLNGIEYLVDRFHIKGHTTKKCDIAEPECLYHPDLPKFSEICDVNTECAEQCFSWLGKFKHTLNYMSQYKFHFLLRNIVEARNQATVLKLKKRGLLKA